MSIKKNLHDFSQSIIDRSEKTNKELIDSIVKTDVQPETRGRKPTGRNEETKAYQRITISLTADQKRQIEERASEAGVSVSKYIKDTLFNEE